MTQQTDDSRAAVDLLTACLRESDRADRLEPCDALGSVAPQALLEAATYHAVSGMLLDPLGACSDLALEAHVELQRRYDQAVHHHLTTMWEVRRIASILDATGVRWALVKGPVLAELVYRDSGMRSYADVDVLVDPAGFDRALEGLAAADLRPLDRNWSVIRRSMRGELHFMLPSGIPLDLHWHLVNMYRGRMQIDTGGMLARAERAAIGGVDAPTLDATDSLIHLALHGTLSGADRLLWMKDITRSIDARPPDWDALAERAAAWGIAAPVGFMLRRAHRMLGAQVPDVVVARLLPRSYARISDIVERISPWQTAGGRVQSGSLLLTRSMGLGLGGAARWLVARTARALDPREPDRSSNFTPSGDRRDADAFVRAVVQSAVDR